MSTERKLQNIFGGGGKREYKVPLTQTPTVDMEFLLNKLQNIGGGQAGPPSSAGPAKSSHHISTKLDHALRVKKGLSCDTFALL